MRRHTLAAAFGGSILFIAGQALAYCRTTTCDQEGATKGCELNTKSASGCSSLGTPIRWPNTCVSTSVSAKGSSNPQGSRPISADEMRGIVQKAFENWTKADCGNGQVPNFVVDSFPDVNCTDVTGDAGYKSTGPNYNIWIFQDTD